MSAAALPRTEIYPFSRATNHLIVGPFATPCGVFASRLSSTSLPGGLQAAPKTAMRRRWRLRACSQPRWLLRCPTSRRFLPDDLMLASKPPGFCLRLPDRRRLAEHRDPAEKGEKSRRHHTFPGGVGSFADGCPHLARFATHSGTGGFLAVEIGHSLTREAPSAHLVFSGKLICQTADKYRQEVVTRHGAKYTTC